MAVHSTTAVISANVFTKGNGCPMGFHTVLSIDDAKLSCSYLY
jgi:hypothetical protein